MGATVLVVEDETSIAETIREALLRAGYEVPEPVSTGTAALELAQRTAPALVLMDVGLVGGMDGIDTAHRLRDEQGVRVVYITGATDDATLQRAKETGPLNYLRKPFTPRELRTAVEIALHQVMLERALAAREHWLTTTLHAITDAVIAADAHEQVTLVNSAAEEMLGVKSVDVLGTRLGAVASVVSTDEPCLDALARRALAEGRSIALPADARVRGPSGLLEVEGTIAPFSMQPGSASGVVMVFRDVGPRRRLERRVGISERLAAIGTMAAGMQHEINNPLATIVANVQFVRDALRAQQQDEGAAPLDTAELLAALEDATVGAERVRATVQELRHLSRPDESGHAPVALATALDAAVRAASNALRHHATVTREYGKTPLVKGSEAQLSRVFVNVLLNAADPGDAQEGRARKIVLATYTDTQGRAVAEVRDDGPGIPRDILHRVFDPFFVKTPKSGDAGLNLTIAHGIITALGGEIDIDSEEGKGTTVRVVLPPAPPMSEPPVVTAAPPVVDATKRRARVLVVDDEVAIGKAVGRVLGREYDVVFEVDARKALERFPDESFDVIFCDLMMPRMTGPEFFEALTERALEQSYRVVFLTGGAFSPKAEELLRTTKNPYLAKPFSREAIVETIRRFTGT